MIKNYLLVAVIILFITNTDTQAQKKKFGDVSRTMLEMEVYDKDSTADAVVLFDVGEVLVDEKLEVTFKRHVRIKILTDKGLEAGDISIGYRSGNPEQDIDDVSAESYYLDENGKMKKTKLGRRDKFDNEVSENWSEIKFTIPGLRKGSVFDYSYEMQSESPVDIPNWYFQSEYPTVWSEYKVSIPEWFNYLLYTRGYNKFNVRDVKKYNDVAIFSYGQRLDYIGTEYHYVIKDVPAIKSESYMTAPIDYLSQIRFQLSSYKFPGGPVENVLNTWPLLVEAINESSNYGERLKDYSSLTSKAEAATENITDELEKMKAIYSYVSSTMQWDDSYGLYVEKNLDDILDEGTGNGTEINLILTSMLRSIGLEADPVIISTRNNGEIVDIYPIDDQFNHTIVRVIIGDKTYLLDGKNERRPYDILPVSSLNGKGLLISDDTKIKWINLKNDVPNKSMLLLSMNVSPDAQLSGTIQSNSSGFFALASNSILSDSDSEEEIKEYLFDTNIESVEIDSIYNKTEENTSTGYKYDMAFTKKIDATGDVMYLNPMVVELIEKNPFEKNERNYPVDYEFGFDKTVIMSFFIPEGWAVDEVPESKAFKMNDNSGFYQRLIRASGNMISLRYDFKISKTRFMPEQYSELKLFYDNVVDEHSKVIVLKKIEE